MLQISKFSTFSGELHQGSHRLDVSRFALSEFSQQSQAIAMNLQMGRHSIVALMVLTLTIKSQLVCAKDAVLHARNDQLTARGSEFSEVKLHLLILQLDIQRIKERTIS